MMVSMTTTRVHIEDLNAANNPTALYCRYDGEVAPQACYIELSVEDESFTASYNGEPGGSNAVPESVVHGRTLRWELPHVLTAAAANKLLADLAPKMDLILTGAEIEWDKDRGAHVGRFDENAAEMIDVLHDELAEIVESYPQVLEYEAAEWFDLDDDQALNLTADTTDERLAALAREHEALAAKAPATGYGVLLDAEKYLTDRREDLRAEVRLQLSSVGYELEAIADKLEELEAQRVRYTQDLATARATRDRLIRQAVGFGDPSREIGSRAGVSHTWVLKMGKQDGDDTTTTNDDQTER